MLNVLLLAASLLSCRDLSNEILGDVALTGAKVRVDDASGSLDLYTEGQEGDGDDLHQGIAARQLATVSPAVSAYIDPTHFYRIQVTIPRLGTNANDCSTRLAGVFAVVCSAADGQTRAAPVDITDLSGRGKAPLTYIANDLVHFQTMRETQDSVGGTVQSPQLTLTIDGVEIADSFQEVGRSDVARCQR